jgi:small subunit ribosomal protein S17
MTAATTSPQTIVGTVVKRGSTQTVRVAVRETKTHPVYRKRYSLVRHFMVHDPEDKARVGDRVTIANCRPISKHKHFVIVEKLTD